ncbi:CPBP family intramembrane metalloprotease [Candidatus Fermentibacteria bacterium]|nr:CPBP family intramembrane metalloprotease [Candidatus Fermentibacteria bacterium]
MGWIHTLAGFGAAGLLLFVATHGLIPLLSAHTGREPILFWFLIGGFGVFAPLLMAGHLLIRREGHPRNRLWTKRLRFRRMSRSDWAWGIGATIVIGILGAGIQAALGALGGGSDLHPPFMAFEPLSPGRYWILAAWLPFWVLNIMGEEVLWRGVVLPRQEVALGPKAWIANACGWLLFHAAFGWYLVIVLLPILIILPYVVQRRRNSWVGVVIHAGVNGPGFIAVALGLV